MKKFLLAFLFFISASEMKISFAQTYHAFPDSSAQWYEHAIQCTEGTCFQEASVLTLSADSVMDGKTYTLVGYNWIYFVSYITGIGFPLSGNYFSYELPGVILGGLRIDSAGKVWFRKLNDTSTFSIYYYLPIDSEILLYDFDLQVGDSLSWKPFNSKVEQIDSVQLTDGGWRKRIHFTSNGMYEPEDWIEGVGSSYGLFGSYEYPPFEGGHFLNCFLQNDTLLWESLGFLQTDCDHFYTGTAEIESEISISVFPNPSSDFITFDLSNFPNEKFTLTIYNSNGQQVSHYSNLHSSQLSTVSFGKIPVSQLGADGLYFYTMSFDAQNSSRFSIGKMFAGKLLVRR